MKSILLMLLLSFVSCTSYVRNIHQQIDKEERISRKGQHREDAPTYPSRSNRFDRSRDKRPISNPQTFSLSDGSPSQQLRPPVKRDYRPQRYQANDFVDSSGDGSLWANQGSSASLFTYQNDKRSGDMVIINVLENLRNQISSELKRVFPDNPKRKALDGAPVAEDKKDQASSSPGKEEEMDMKVYDKISGTVVEEISKDYILLRGRKDVIYKKEKKSIEVQGLVSRKDIMENDYVNSDKLLDSRVTILKRD
jgi:flagellar basal body L-ring protein FlgH